MYTCIKIRVCILHKMTDSSESFNLRGMSLYERLPNGTTPINDIINSCSSAKQFQAKVCDLLANRDFSKSIDLKDDSGNTAVHLLLQKRYMSCFPGNTDIFSVDNTSSYAVRNKNGDTPIHIAVRNGISSTLHYFDILTAHRPENMLKLESSRVFLLKNNKGKTPLAVAVDSFNIESIAVIGKFINPSDLEECFDAKDVNGSTILQCAVASGNQEIVTAVLKLYYSKLTDTHNSILSTPEYNIFKAISEHQIECIVDFYLANPEHCKIPTIDAIFDCSNISYKRLSVIRYRKNAEGCTIFHRLAQLDDPDIFNRAFRFNNACDIRYDLGQSNKKGQTPLMCMVPNVNILSTIKKVCGSQFIKELLCDRCEKGYTFAHSLCTKDIKYGDSILECLRFLETVDPNILTHNGSSFLELVNAHCHHPELRMYLKSKTSGKEEQMPDKEVHT